MIVDHSEFTVKRYLNNGEEIGNRLLRRLFCKQHFLDIPHLIQSIAVCFQFHMHRSIIRHLCRCYTQTKMHRDHIFSICPHTNRHEPSFERLLENVSSNAYKSFYCQIVINILLMLVILMPNGRWYVT